MLTDSCGAIRTWKNHVFRCDNQQGYPVIKIKAENPALHFARGTRIKRSVLTCRISSGCSLWSVVARNYCSIKKRKTWELWEGRSSSKQYHFQDMQLNVQSDHHCDHHTCMLIILNRPRSQTAHIGRTDSFLAQDRRFLPHNQLTKVFRALGFT